MYERKPIVPALPAGPALPPLPKTSTDALMAMILPWAKAFHRDKYDETLKVSMDATKFRRYLIRLIEIRWSEDVEWKTDANIPLDVLEDSAMTVLMRHRPTGMAIEVKGRLAEKPRTWSFAELAMLQTLEPEQKDEMMGRLIEAKFHLDLELAE